MIKKKWRSIVAAALCGGLMMGMQPVQVQAAEAQSMIQVATEATVHMGESREVLRLVNEARAQKGPPRSSMPGDLWGSRSCVHISTSSGAPARPADRLERRFFPPFSGLQNLLFGGIMKVGKGGLFPPSSPRSGAEPSWILMYHPPL